MPLVCLLSNDGLTNGFLRRVKPSRNCWDRPFAYGCTAYLWLVSDRFVQLIGKILPHIIVCCFNYRCLETNSLIFVMVLSLLFVCLGCFYVRVLIWNSARSGPGLYSGCVRDRGRTAGTRSAREAHDPEQDYACRYDQTFPGIFKLIGYFSLYSYGPFNWFVFMQVNSIFSCREGPFFCSHTKMGREPRRSASYLRVVMANI